MQMIIRALQLVDYNNSSNFVFGDAGSGSADITEAVDTAIAYGSDTLLIAVESGASESTLDPPYFGDEYLTITYEQY
ncbi:MAG: hypothetical protein U5P10_11785 [Spirochaetia bacterium]|nr:hypothetical protein [Spirochaetia bacterium]